MCLGVPGRIVEQPRAVVNELAMALVEFGGVTRPVCVSLTPDAGMGDYVLVHAGIALQKIDEDHARELLEHLRAMGDGEMAELADNVAGRRP